MKKRYKVIIPLVIVVAILAWLILWMQSPSEGSVSKKPPTSTKQVSTFQDKKLDGEYIAFQYSGKYVPSANVAANNDVERYTLSAGTNYDKRIQAAVVNLPDGKLESNGDYIFRQKTPSVYTKRQLKTSVGTYDIWVKTDGTEQTAMAAKGNKAIVITLLTSPGVEDNLTVEADTLLNSLQWKK